VILTAALGGDLPVAPARSARPGVVERVTLIIDAFEDAPEHLLLEDIAKITGLPRSTASRILRQLVELRWVEHGSRGFRLGPRMRYSGARSADYENLRVAAAVPLTELQIATGAVTHLSVLDGGIVHYLDKLGGAAANTVPSRVGGRLLACDTVSGRAMLSCLLPEQVDELMSSCLSLSAMASADLHQELTTIQQRRGIAVSPGAHRASGVSSIAAPVLGPDGPVAAISVARRGDLLMERVAPMVAFAARRTARALFPSARESRARNRPNRLAPPRDARTQRIPLAAGGA
jgi:DNA-binding IclR family transcriptional regulator